MGEELAVVTIVRVPVPTGLPVMLTGLVELKLRVGGTTAPLGLVVTTAVRATLPVKPPVGVRVIVEVFPVVAPAVTLMLPLLLSVKLGVGATLPPTTNCRPAV